jgi:hypothetical protein
LLRVDVSYFTAKKISQLFSLPSTTPGAIDVGMCIVTLLNFLQNCHNDLFV